MNENGETLPARKTTGWMTNSPEIAEELCKYQCSTRTTNITGEYHEHAQFISGTARACENYPDELVVAMLRGLEKQLGADKRLQLNGFEIGYNVDPEPLDWDDPELEEYVDDVSGVSLEPEKVRTARRTEIDFMHGFAVYEKVPYEQSEGKVKIALRWCGVNNGDRGRPEYRSRFVGKELKRRDPMMDGTFAATPPLESPKYVLHQPHHDFANGQRPHVEREDAGARRIESTSAP